MKLIIGLGNPEQDYSGTRHNMGFDVINELSKNYDIEVNKNKFKSLFGDGIIEGQKVILLKPQTFMNLSGEAVNEVVSFYKIPLEDILVIYDDLDIEPGKIRIRKSGSPGSHNGIKSVTHFLKSNDFARVRVGIGKPDSNIDLIEYVIGGIDENEKEILKLGVSKAVEAIIEIIKNNIDSAMNKYN